MPDLGLQVRRNPHAVAGCTILPGTTGVQPTKGIFTSKAKLCCTDKIAMWSALGLQGTLLTMCDAIIDASLTQPSPVLVLVRSLVLALFNRSSHPGSQPLPAADLESLVVLAPYPATLFPRFSFPVFSPSRDRRYIDPVYLTGVVVGGPGKPEEDVSRTGQLCSIFRSLSLCTMARG